jgi:hypothetical protein
MLVCDKHADEHNATIVTYNHKKISKKVVKGETHEYKHAESTRRCRAGT